MANNTDIKYDEQWSLELTDVKTKEGYCTKTFLEKVCTDNDHLLVEIYFPEHGMYLTHFFGWQFYYDKDEDFVKDIKLNNIDWSNTEAVAGLINYITGPIIAKIYKMVPSRSANTSNTSKTRTIKYFIMES